MKKMFIMCVAIGLLVLCNKSFGDGCPGMYGAGTPVYQDGSTYCGEVTASECVKLGGTVAITWGATGSTPNLAGSGYATACANANPVNPIGSASYSQTTGYVWNILSLGANFKWKPGIIIGPEFSLDASGSITYDNHVTTGTTHNFGTNGCTRTRVDVVYYNKPGTVSLPIEFFAEYTYERDESADEEICVLPSGIYYGNASTILSSTPYSATSASTTTVMKVYDFISTDVTVTCPYKACDPCQKLTPAGAEP